MASSVLPMLKKFKSSLVVLKNSFLHTYFRFASQKNGFNLAGYFSHVMGVAEVGRFFSIKLHQSQIPFTIFSIDVPSHQVLDKEELAKYEPFYTTRSDQYVNIFFVNADAIPYTARTYPALFRCHYNIGVFWWEFDDYFEFPKAFNHLNEVVVFSEFIATAVRKTAPQHIRVTKLPFPFVKNWQIIASPIQVRNRYHIQESDYTFFFNFDFYSIFERKNPTAVLKAFQMAFPTEKNVKLILKTVHSEKVPEKYQGFVELLEGLHIRDRVVIIEDNLARNEMMSLINAADVYVSLHRSEGLGIGMLEAMSMGKPVIGTRFGGNMEFMNDEVALLVDYTLVPLEKDLLPYKQGWLWADADVDQAAQFMRKLYEDRQYGMELGKKAARFIENHYSLDNFKKTLSHWAKKTPVKLPW